MVRKILNIYKDSFSNLTTEVWLLATIMVINRMGAMILPFASLYMTKELGFTLSDAGYVMGAYGVGSILGAFVGGELSDKFGAYPVQFASLMLSGAMLVIFINLTSFLPIMICMFLYALMTDLLRPANSVATASFSTEQNRTRSYSLMRFAANLGFAIGPAIGGIVAGTLGYVYIFVIDIISCLLAALILYRYLKPNKSIIVDEITFEENKATRLSSQSAYGDRLYLFFIVLVALYGITFFQIFSSMPLFFKKEWGMSEVNIGLLLSFNGLFIVLFEMPFMRRVEGKRNPWLMMAKGCAAMVLGYILIVVGYQTWLVAISIIVLFSFSEMFAMPFMTQFAISRASLERRGQYMALYAMAFGVAHSCAPLGALFMADRIGFINTYIAALVISLLIALAFLFTYKRLIRKDS